MKRNTESVNKQPDAAYGSRPSGQKSGAIALKASVILLILSLFVCSGIFTYARFTNSLQAQRTVAAYDKFGERFSSNYLQGGEGVNVRTVSVASAEEIPMAIVTVCNYDQGRQQFVNSQDVDYTVSLRAVKYDNESGTYVNATAGDMGANQITVSHGGNTVTLSSSKLWDDSFSGTLSSAGAASDAYTVVFTPYQNTVFLRMTVTPDEDLHLSTLSGILKSEIRMAGVSSSWSGSFQDSQGNDPADYDGFNYRVSGVGSGTFTLRWDATRVELLAPSLLTLLSIDDASRVGNSITFPVDADTVNLYDLQFSKIYITDEDWDDMEESVVTYDFVGS